MDKQNFSTTASPNDINVTDKLFEAFRNYAAADKANGLTAANINSQADYAKMRIREELATATYSNEAGVRVILENDPQLSKAVAVCRRPRELARLSPTAAPLGEPRVILGLLLDAKLGHAFLTVKPVTAGFSKFRIDRDAHAERCADLDVQADRNIDGRRRRPGTERCYPSRRPNRNRRVRDEVPRHRGQLRGDSWRSPCR